MAPNENLTTTLELTGALEQEKSRAFTVQEVSRFCRERHKCMHQHKKNRRAESLRRTATQTLTNTQTICSAETKQPLFISQKTLQHEDKTLTFVDVLVQLVDKRVQLLPLLSGKLQRIAAMNPLAQGTGTQRKRSQTEIQSGVC